MNKLDEHNLRRHYQEDLQKKRQEYSAINMVMCEKCQGTGIKSRGFKSIVECDECDGAGGFNREPTGGIGNALGMFNDRYGISNIWMEEKAKPKYKYNWKTGKAELIKQ